MKASATTFRLSAAFVFAAFSASAAQFQPTTGGNLDDAANWNSPGDNTFAVLKPQSGPLTLSTAAATLPNAAGNLQYRNANVYTNEFGAGYALTLTGSFVAYGSPTLVHRSGSLSSSASNSSIQDATVVVEGPDAALTFASITMPADKGGSVLVRDGALLTITSSLTVNAGASVTVEEATLAQNTTMDNALSFETGATLSMRNATLRWGNSKGKLLLSGSVASFDGTTVVPGSQTMIFGGDGGTALFLGNPSTVTGRFNMLGDDFTFCVSNTTVNFAPTSAGDLFITSGGTVSDGFAKTLRFCGAAPRLAVGSSNGFYLRAQKGVTLQFDIPAEGYPTNAAIVEITGGGSFKGDAGCLASSQIVVNIDGKCPPGTYTLLKGTKAGTFLDVNDRVVDKWVANAPTSRKATFQTATVDGLSALQIIVKTASKGTVLTFR